MGSGDAKNGPVATPRYRPTPTARSTLRRVALRLAPTALGARSFAEGPREPWCAYAGGTVPPAPPQAAVRRKPPAFGTGTQARGERFAGGYGRGRGTGVALRPGGAPATTATSSAGDRRATSAVRRRHLVGAQPTLRSRSWYRITLGSALHRDSDSCDTYRGFEETYLNGVWLCCRGFLQSFCVHSVGAARVLRYITYPAEAMRRGPPSWAPGSRGAVGATGCLLV